MAESKAFPSVLELSLHKANEPQHDQSNKMACAPSKVSDQPGHTPSLISLSRVYGS